MVFVVLAHIYTTFNFRKWTFAHSVNGCTSKGLCVCTKALHAWIIPLFNSFENACHFLWNEIPYFVYLRLYFGITLCPTAPKSHNDRPDNLAGNQWASSCVRIAFNININLACIDVFPAKLLGTFGATLETFAIHGKCSVCISKQIKVIYRNVCFRCLECLRFHACCTYLSFAPSVCVWVFQFA